MGGIGTAGITGEGNESCGVLCTRSFEELSWEEVDNHVLCRGKQDPAREGKADTRKGGCRETYVGHIGTLDSKRRCIFRGAGGGKGGECGGMPRYSGGF